MSTTRRCLSAVSAASRSGAWAISSALRWRGWAPSARDDRHVEAAGAERRVGEVDDLVCRVGSRAATAARARPSCRADVPGDHAQGSLGDAPADPGGGLAVRGVPVQHGRGQVLAERQPGEPVVVLDLDHGCSWPSAGRGSPGAAPGRAP